MDGPPTHGLDPSALEGYQPPDAASISSRWLHSRKFGLAAGTFALVVSLVVMYVLFPQTREAEPAITRALNVLQVIVVAYLGVEGGADLLSRWRQF